MVSLPPTTSDLVSPAVQPTLFLSVKQSESIAFHNGVGTALTRANNCEEGLVL